MVIGYIYTTADECMYIKLTSCNVHIPKTHENEQEGEGHKSWIMVSPSPQAMCGVVQVPWQGH